MKIYETLESGIKIVDYNPSLAPSLAEMWNICGQNDEDDWGGESGISTPSQVIATHEAASHYNVYLALDGETVVGYCSFGRYFADANTLYIPLLGVRPDYRSKKIGKALVLRCIQRTIELGYPQLDLFTWSGNTAAVPLYKKCGFMWEDRPDGTHLANYIPTIATAPIFADFFKKASWYADSTRSMEISPDGIQENGFELFCYSWEKDGDMLKVGYERAGRQMRMIETNDYKIELMAEDHNLAFGTEYNCTFAIVNKTGKELNIKITGRKEANISLDCNVNLQVTSKEEVTASFRVGPINEPQHPWKVHPCLLASLEINGKAVTFGLGINPKFPLLVGFDRECTVDQTGMDVKTHISLESALPEDAAVTINIPKGKILGIKGAEKPFKINIPAKGKVSIPTTTTTLAIGFEKLTLDCTAVLKSGKEVSFAVPAFTTTRDLTHAFSTEDLTHFSIYNGPWGIRLDKTENEAGIVHLTNKHFFSHGAYDPPKLGKPFDDEFNLIKPNIKACQQAGQMIMEAEYISEKFPGMVVTQVYTLYASGLFSRINRVENRADKPRSNMLQDSYGLELSVNSIYSYKGQITKNQERANPGGILEGFQNASPEGIDENWVFEDNPIAPRGYCWPKEYKPYVKWDVNVSFDIDLGELAPGQIFETRPVVYALGLFANYNDLRNYAQQIYNPSVPPAIQAMEVVLNNYNPFLPDSNAKLEIINNRDEVQEGTITVSSESLSAPMTQTNPHEDIVARNSYDLSLDTSTSIAVVDVAMNMVGYEKTCRKAIFMPKGEVRFTQNDTLYTVSNGAITFKADPKYGHGCFSLTDAKGQEWLLSQYPDHKPFSWFNPFIGGLRIRIADMDERAMLKENITADFVEMKDNHGNLWQGMCVSLAVTEDERLKGATYKSYYLTQPGLPVLCSFYKVENNTGAYKNDRVWISACINPDDDAKNTIVEVTTKDGSRHRRRMGSIEMPDFYYEGAMEITTSRQQRLYGICSCDNGGTSDFWGSNKIPVMAAFSYVDAVAAHGEVFTSNPVFLVVADTCLPDGALGDLERIKF
ncbi:MAG: GNAT family N-acetyltransferase [Defluviitaleaceae bacterium]|nr:GNAT family N-acetyltransferase [Defluviitaleaceae bacterium]